VTDSDQFRSTGSFRGDAARRERLAVELRANLKRRKEQARARAGASKEGIDTPARPHDADRSEC
jgi:hypothetical protein